VCANFSKIYTKKVREIFPELFWGEKIFEGWDENFYIFFKKLKNGQHSIGSFPTFPPQNLFLLRKISKNVYWIFFSANFKICIWKKLRNVFSKFFCVGAEEEKLSSKTRSFKSPIRFWAWPIRLWSPTHAYNDVVRFAKCTVQNFQTETNPRTRYSDSRFPWRIHKLICPTPHLPKITVKISLN
jgi:hypothetical protein